MGHSSLCTLAKRKLTALSHIVLWGRIYNNSVYPGTVLVVPSYYPSYYSNRDIGSKYAGPNTNYIIVSASYSLVGLCIVVVTLVVGACLHPLQNRHIVPFSII